MEQFPKKVLPTLKWYPGEVLNLALAICPEAAGFEKGSRSCPQYTGENLFDLMEYKRFQDWRREYDMFHVAKFYFPVEVTLVPAHGPDAIELSPAEAAAFHQQISERIARQIQPDSCWSDWEGYGTDGEKIPCGLGSAGGTVSDPI